MRPRERWKMANGPVPVPVGPDHPRGVLGAERLDAVVDRGHISGEEIPACGREAGIVTLPKPMTSAAKADGRLDKRDFAPWHGSSLRPFLRPKLNFPIGEL